MNNTLQYKVTEGAEHYTRNHSGFKMATLSTGRRYRTNTHYAVPNGIFHGTVFFEVEDVVTGDWGDGLETKRTVRPVHVAHIEGHTNRELVEARTKAVFEALDMVRKHSRLEAEAAQCVLAKCSTPELCNDFGKCDADLLRKEADSNG